MHTRQNLLGSDRTRMEKKKKEKRGGDAMWEGSGSTCLPVRVLFVFPSDKSI